MISKIDQAIVKREQENDENPLFEECVQHLEFCKRKCQAFGREEYMQVGKNYIHELKNITSVVDMLITLILH
jgi:hypothetical protein